MATHLVTGTASGLGAAIRRRLERDGHRVIGVDRRDAEILADLATEDGRRDAVAAGREAAGDALDGVVSCAGLGPYDEPQPVIRVNFFGALAVLEGLRDALTRGREPAAVAISSIGGAVAEVAVPELIAACHAGDEKRAVELAASIDGNTAYCNAKRALAQAVRRRAPEWGARRVRLNAVAPGKTETPMLDELLRRPDHAPAIEALPVPLGRSAPPDEVAAAVVFLLGPDARYVHGHVLFVDGGADAVMRPDQI
jgi:NAD(P)-dependent dehydrogenase (short-subunit alcohol dehydrogenase family)